MSTKIEWTDETWNPITGCTKISPGCKHCYAERMARRLAGRYGYPEVPHHFDVTLRPDRLEQPLHWKKPRMIFVASMGDLFHEDVPFTFIVQVFDMMHNAPHHTYQVLTKRPRRMKAFIEAHIAWYASPIPDNIWLGVSVENQATADERIPILLQTPAAVRFVSCEPLLKSVSLRPHTGSARWLGPLPPERFYGPCDPWSSKTKIIERPRATLDWVIVGGESGPGARPMHPDWARSIRDQCQAAGGPYFMKQWGAWIPFGQGKGEEIPSGAEECWLDIRGQSNPTYSAMMHNPSKLWRVGKKRAGCLLDGREVKEWPNLDTN